MKKYIKYLSLSLVASLFLFLSTSAQFEAPHYWDLKDNTTIQPSEYSPGNRYAVDADGVMSSTVSDVTYYIAPSPTGDDNNDCSAGSPCKTLDHVWNDVLPVNINHLVTINAASGTYYETNDSLIGKYVVNGSILFQGAITVQADDGGSPYTATGGDNKNVNGLGEIDVATAGWGVNAYAGMFVRYVTTTSPTAEIQVKYSPIISNSATQLVVPYLYFTPDGNTTFDIVTFDSVFTSSTAAAPTVGVNIPISFDSNLIPDGDVDPDGLYTRYPVTFDALHVKNSAAYNGLVKVSRGAIFFRGVDGESDSTINASVISGFKPTSSITVIGAKTSGQIGGLLYLGSGAVGSASTIYSDMTTSTYNQRYTITADGGGWAYMDSYYIVGDSGNRVFAAIHSDQAGSNGTLGSGRVEYANAIMDAGKNSYISPNSSDVVYGNNNTYLYTGSSGAIIQDYPQANVTVTQTYNIDDTVFVANKIAGRGQVVVSRQRETIVNVAGTEFSIDAAEQLLTPASPVTMTSTPTIEDGIYDGQKITLYGSTNTTTLQDDSILSGSNLSFVDGKNRVLGVNGIVTFIWDEVNSIWLEYGNTSSLTANRDFNFNSPSGGSGTYWTAGYYSYSAADANLTQASTTVNFGTANVAYGAHAFAVMGGACTTDATTVSLTVSGTSVTDAGVRNAADSEELIADCTGSIQDDYLESNKKWIGQITYTLASGGATTFAGDFNYGYAKYDDLGNRDFTITDFEITGMAGANDANFNISLVKHEDANWTYSAAAFVPTPTEILDLQTDYNTEYQLASGIPFAYKRANLAEFINGSDMEGFLIRIITSSNGAVERSNIHISATY